MDESIIDEKQPVHKDESSAADLVKLTIAIICMLLGMYWSWNAIGVSGQETTIGSFIGLWLHEIILFGIMIVAAFFAGLLWLLRLFRKMLGRNKSGL
nr:hypothetical protein [uncultured Undibacterium sp.]